MQIKLFKCYRCEYSLDGAIEGTVVRTSGQAASKGLLEIQSLRLCPGTLDSGFLAEGPGSQDSVLTRSLGTHSLVRTSVLYLLRISPSYWKHLVSVEGTYAVGIPC